MSNKKRNMSQCLSFSFSRFIFLLLSKSSIAVHVCLWNGVDWMVVFFVFLFLFLTPVTKLIGIVRTEVSVAPNVELMGRQRQILLNIIRQIKRGSIHIL